MLNEIDTTYMSIQGILVPFFIFASGLAALVSMLGIVGVWLLKNFVDGWPRYE